MKLISINVAHKNLHYKFDSLKFNVWNECSQFLFKLWSIAVFPQFEENISASTARMLAPFLMSDKYYINNKQC